MSYDIFNIPEAMRMRNALAQAHARVLHLAHISDQSDEFQMFTVGALSFILEALIPELSDSAKEKES